MPWYRVVLLGLAAAAAFAVSTLLVVRELSTPTRNAAETKSERAPARPETAAAPGRDAAPGGASTRIQDRVPVGIAPSVPKTVEPPRAPAARLELTTAQIDRVRYVLLSHNVMQVEATDFPLQLGAALPEAVALTPLPPELSDIVPAYRHYSYVIAKDRIAIVLNDNRRISSLISL